MSICLVAVAVPVWIHWGQGVLASVLAIVAAALPVAQFVRDRPARPGPAKPGCPGFVQDMPVRDVDPVDLGVKPAIDHASRGVPEYVPRDDEQSRSLAR